MSGSDAVEIPGVPLPLFFLNFDIIILLIFLGSASEIFEGILFESLFVFLAH